MPQYGFLWILGVQDYSGSSISTPLINSLPVLVIMINSMFVPTCNRSHARGANCGEITSFRGTHISRPHLS